MLPVAIVYAGFLAMAAGAVSLVRPLRFLRVRTRTAALGVAGGGLALVLAGMAFPAGLRRAEQPETLLDEWLPQWQFSEFHSLRVQATPEQAWHAIREVTGDEIFLLRTLTAIRNPRFPWSEPQPEHILNPPGHKPVLEVAIAGGFHLLAEDAPREIVLGTVVAHDGVTRFDEDVPGHQRIRKLLTRPGNAVAAINFRVRDDGDGFCTVSTETRVFATDAAARRRFAAYWRVIYPGSSLLRYTWLRAIRARAERTGSTGS